MPKFIRKMDGAIEHSGSKNATNPGGDGDGDIRDIGRAGQSG